MALQTLKDVKEIGGFEVYNASGLYFASDYAGWHDNQHPIMIDHNNNAISFKLQSAPISEVGINGCQVDTLIYAAMEILKGLNAQFQCKENDAAIDYLYDAITELENRKKDRETRGVEGTSQE
jgi:hypothetical protein